MKVFETNFGKNLKNLYLKIIGNCELRGSDSGNWSVDQGSGLLLPFVGKVIWAVYLQSAFCFVT